MRSEQGRPEEGRGENSAETIPIRTGADVSRVRRSVATAMAVIGLLAALLAALRAAEPLGEQVDEGGVDVVDRAARVVTGGQRHAVLEGGLGLGLSGARRLCKEFEIRSVPGEGTVVKVASWTERP